MALTCIRPRVIVLSVVLSASTTACTMPWSAQVPTTRSYSSKQMADGKAWLTENVDINIGGSYCYQDDEPTCRRYGRLYTWDAAQRACQSLGDGWRLPSDDDWRQLTRHHGGVFGESADSGKSAYKLLVMGGNSGFEALLGGGRSPDGREYSRLEAHGFYWTASADSPATATFYNFGRGSLALYRQSEGEKQRAFSVRCVRDNA